VVSGFCDRRKKQAIRDRFDRLAVEREYWQRESLYYEDQCQYFRFLVSGSFRVLGGRLAVMKPENWWFPFLSLWGT
jgi:hypothetical protein